MDKLGLQIDLENTTTYSWSATQKYIVTFASKELKFRSICHKVCWIKIFFIVLQKRDRLKLILNSQSAFVSSSERSPLILLAW